MTHQAPSPPALPGADPARQIAQLREALALVERIAGLSAAALAHDDLFEEAARLSDDYDRAMPIVQRRFDALAVEIADWAAAGIEALLAPGGGEGSPNAAARRLAAQLDRAIQDLTDLIRR